MSENKKQVHAIRNSFYMMMEEVRKRTNSQIERKQLSAMWDKWISVIVMQMRIQLRSRVRDQIWRQGQ